MQSMSTVNGQNVDAQRPLDENTPENLTISKRNEIRAYSPNVSYKTRLTRAILF